MEKLPLKPYRTKQHRLPPDAYEGQKVVSFTACIRGNGTPFVGEKVVRACIESLQRAVESHRCLVPIYCFMPDHVHLLIQGREDVSRPKAAMDSFKYLSGRWFATNRPETLWQKSYYDHVLRGGDDLKRHAFYIPRNPVRAGLALDGYEYPFTGSIGYDLVELLHDVAW